jgi:hypothetical protein
MRKVTCYIVIEPDSDRVYFMQKISEEYAAKIPKDTEIFELEAYLPPKEVPIPAQAHVKGNINAKVRKMR